MSPTVSVLLGLDVGTSGTRVLAVEPRTGEVVGQASATYEVRTPHPGWTEQDPGTWVAAARQVLGTVMRDLGEAEVLGLGLAGQMHGSVFLDAADAVIRPALLWNDQRTDRAVEEIEARIDREELIRIAGTPALTGFQAPKLLWLRDAEPQAWARVASVLLPKDYVRLVLCGDRATDMSDASGTLMLDVGRRRWSPEVLDALEIPAAWLPSVHEGHAVTGGVRTAVARELGLPGGLPVAAGGGDNAAAAVGVAVSEPGQLLSSIGTSGVLFAPTPGFAPDPSGRLHEFCHALPDRYHAMAVMLAAGASLDWWRRTVGARSFAELVDEAERVAPGAEGLVFLPYLTGERTPHLDPRARGGFVGLSVRHGRAEMTRAVMEGVVLALRDGLEVMRGLGVAATEVRAVGGGARSALWRRLQADVLGLPVRRTVVDEGPAYGAALLAGVACGEFADVDEAMSRVHLRDEVDEPEPAAVARYDERSALFGSLYAPLRAAMHELADQGADLV